MKTKRFERKDVLTTVLSIITIGISLFALIRSCVTDSKLDEANYRISSVEHRPRLKLSNPEILSINISVDSISSVANNKSSDSVSNLYVDIDLRIKVKVINIGNSTAKVSGWVITDTLSERDIIRTEIFKNHNVEYKGIGVQLDTPIFPHYLQELAPQDSSFIEFKYKVQSFSDKGFTMHILIYYENELHQLFDTYYWAHIDKKNILLKSSNIIQGHSIDQIKLSKEALKIIEIKSDNNDSEIYTKKQRALVLHEFEN